ncbi:chloride channel protein [uncultured Christiangramia sp.]|uniref:chloride channel protein n=1 Tax=Christiangramia sp. 3-2217-3z TaxID=3417564 RepID=UPI0034520800
MASGFTALFGAPLGGSLFSLGILHHKHAVEYYKAIIPAFVASCFSYIIFALIIHLRLGPIWDLPSYGMQDKFDFIMRSFLPWLEPSLPGLLFSVLKF